MGELIPFTQGGARLLRGALGESSLKASGYGSGFGSGYGSGSGDGSGYGDGYGDGSGSGYGSGYGDGSGSGDGSGDGDGKSEADLKAAGAEVVDDGEDITLPGVSPEGERR